MNAIYKNGALQEGGKAVPWSEPELLAAEAAKADTPRFDYLALEAASTVVNLLLHSPHPNLACNVLN